MQSAAYSRPHFALLDGMRGVAALMVVVYHCFECFPPDTWIIGHGYLAVDFFFILSGFVIGYAYDSRLAAGKLSAGGFLKRRLVRLHPMVVFGLVSGLAAFLIQGSVRWDGSKVGVSAIMLAVLLHLFMLPELPGSFGEVRGNGEMFPLNGPHWSLFYEYIASFLYVSLLRKLPKKWLALAVAVSFAAYAAVSMADFPGYGNIGVGWTAGGGQFWLGLLRMLFPFGMGLLMSRDFRPAKVRGAFWICSAIVVVSLGVPALGKWNIFYELCCVALVFPLAVYLGASGSANGPVSFRLCGFLGDISYPLYAVHYPSMYLFYNYIGFPDTFRTPAGTWPWMVLLVVGNIALAWLALRFYDQPLRKRLSR